MQTTHLQLWAGIPAFMSMVSSGYAGVSVMRDATSEKQELRSLRKAERVDPIKSLPVARNEEPLGGNRPKDLLSQSDILCFGGMATLVPKQAILQIPESYSERLKIESGVKIADWADFLAANRSWITTVEISPMQAEGKEPLAEDTRTMLTECHNLVVTTYQGGPISIRDPRSFPG